MSNLGKPRDYRPTFYNYVGNGKDIILNVLACFCMMLVDIIIKLVIWPIALLGYVFYKD